MSPIIQVAIPLISIVLTFVIFFVFNLFQAITTGDFLKLYFGLFVLLFVINNFILKLLESKITVQKQFDTVINYAPKENNELWFIIFNFFTIINSALSGVFLALVIVAMAKAGANAI